MLVIPTIYLRNHRVVNPAPEARFHLPEDPMALAEEMAHAGVHLLHLIDLDAPQTTGHIGHADLVRQLCDKGRFAVQIAGPIRTVEAIDRYLQLGVSRVILGTIAYQIPTFTAEAGKKFPGKLGIEIDVRNHKVMIKGWTVAANKTALDYAVQFRSAGIAVALYSDVNEAGQITPANFQGIREFARQCRMPVIHATDLNSLEELEHVLLLEKFGVTGTLLSKSLYDGRFDIKGLITLAMERGLPDEESTLIPE